MKVFLKTKTFASFFTRAFTSGDVAAKAAAESESADLLEEAFEDSES